MARGAAQNESLFIPTNRPLWREAFFGLDWLALRASPVFYGLGVPQGDGSAVIVVPGFLGSDRYLTDMYLWLGRIGYRAYFSRIGRNLDCPDLLTRKLIETAERAAGETGGPVSIVGHSLGGLLARAVAVQRPDLVHQVITMGAPFRDIRAHPLVLVVADLVRFGVIMPRRARAEVDDLCFTDECGCAFARSVLDEKFAAGVAHWSIYSRNDGVVDWRSCVEDDDRYNIEVGATHVGMAFSRAVYEWLGDLLAGEAPASMSA